MIPIQPRSGDRGRATAEGRGIRCEHDKPRSGERICRRSAAHDGSEITATAFSRGYTLSPLRGSIRDHSEFLEDHHGVDQDHPWIHSYLEVGSSGPYRPVIHAFIVSAATSKEFVSVRPRFNE